MKLDTLTKLNHKKKLWITPKHPLFFENIEFRIVYSAGVFMQAGLNKTVSTLNNFELERIILKGLGLSSSDAAKVIKLAKDGSQTVDRVIEILDTPLKKYLFLLDLYSVGMRPTYLSEEEKQSIHIFTELLRLEESDVRLLEFFVHSAFIYDTKDCIKAFEEMLAHKMPITMSELKFYIPELEYVTAIQQKSIRAGEQIRLVDHCKLTDTILVPKNTTLIIDNAYMSMHGGIVIDGGKLVIRNSTLINHLKGNRALIQVKNFSEIELYDSTFDCRYFGAVINQENGNLVMERCKVSNTSNQSAVKFWGNDITVTNCTFKNCITVRPGGAIRIKNGKGAIQDCVFEECEAKNGGAIHTINEVMILTSMFKFCRALEHGSAIYYQGEVKSNVVDCEYIECFPEKEELIQCIEEPEEKVITKECTIRVSTILNTPIKVKEMGILAIFNAVVYVNRPIICSGQLNLKHSRLVASNPELEYLVVLDRARGAIVEKCEFDGKEGSGIFRATGTKLYVDACLFRNCAKGRAIYDAYEPKIKNTIFSNCLNGALSTCAGTISDCSFIHCKDKSGAGILIYGMKGEITHCQFIRCVTDYSGGGIDKSGGHRISDCYFEECRPNNMN